MKVLVCGSRYCRDFTTVCNGLNVHAPEAEVLIHGGATGVDSLAQDWADHHDIPCIVYPADWKRHGKAAGPIRNQVMLDEGKPDLVVAFPGGRGTADMVRRARAAGVTVIEATHPTDCRCAACEEYRETLRKTLMHEP